MVLLSKSQDSWVHETRYRSLLLLVTLLQKFYFLSPLPYTLVTLEFLGSIMIQLSWKLRPPPDDFRLFMLVNQQAQKAVLCSYSVLAGMMDPDCLVELDCSSTVEPKKEHVWKTEDPVWCPLVLLCPVIQVRSMENYNNPIQEVFLMTQTL